MTAIEPLVATLDRYWPHRGGSFEALMASLPEERALPAPRDDEVIARVEAVSICSSDIKIVRMGPAHPLLGAARGPVDTVLGHEVCLRVHAVGAGQEGRFRPGQRLGLQPAMRIAGERRIIGMDVPGGFAKYLRLPAEALAEYVLDVPETISAAAVALLEPYGCVERAWRPNARRDFKPGGRALFVVGADAGFTLSDVPDWSAISLVGPRPGFLGTRTAQQARDLASLEGPFDDILALGDLSGDELARACELLAVGGLLLQGRRSGPPGAVPLDFARIHYDELAFLGTSETDLRTAFAPARQRFDVRPGGVALVHGAGGAMGRIHVHRLLHLKYGPKTVIATSRKGQRLADLQADFGPLAETAGRRLVVVTGEDLAETVSRLAPERLDDAVVVAPSPEAIGEVLGQLAPDGLLAVFAGFPYGNRLPVDLGRVATHGLRITGSTGCSVDDMRGVLERAERGELDLSVNIAAVADLAALPQALGAVANGTVSGKIIVYPHAPSLPLTSVTDWNGAREAGLTG